jgi:streptogramin lyase
VRIETLRVLKVSHLPVEALLHPPAGKLEVFPHPDGCDPGQVKAELDGALFYGEARYHRVES